MVEQSSYCKCIWPLKQKVGVKGKSLLAVDAIWNIIDSIMGIKEHSRNEQCVQVLKFCNLPCCEPLYLRLVRMVFFKCHLKMQSAFSVILLLGKIVGVDIKGERCFGFAAVEWRSSSSEVWNWRVDLLSLPALTSRCERRALAGERFSPHGAIFFFSLSIKTQGPLIGSPPRTAHCRPQTLIHGDQCMGGAIGGYEMVLSLPCGYLSLTAFFSLIAF